MESSKIPLIMYLKKKHLPSGRKEKNRCWADPFSRLIYIHWWRFWEIKAAAFFLSFSLPQRQLYFFVAWLWFTYRQWACSRSLCHASKHGAEYFNSALCHGTGRRRDRRTHGNVPKRRPAAQDKDPIGAAETAKGVDAERRLDADE